MWLVISALLCFFAHPFLAEFIFPIILIFYPQRIVAWVKKQRSSAISAHNIIEMSEERMSVYAQVDEKYSDEPSTECQRQKGVDG